MDLAHVSKQAVPPSPNGTNLRKGLHNNSSVHLHIGAILEDTDLADSQLRGACSAVRLQEGLIRCEFGQAAPLSRISKEVMKLTAELQTVSLGAQAAARDAHALEAQRQAAVADRASQVSLEIVNIHDKRLSTMTRTAAVLKRLQLVNEDIVVEEGLAVQRQHEEDALCRAARMRRAARVIQAAFRQYMTRKRPATARKAKKKRNARTASRKQAT